VRRGSALSSGLEDTMDASRLAARSAVALALAFVVAQAIPYGRDHTNPPARREPDWTPRTRELAARACFDCHSNETRWPWYSHVAPFSWLTQSDVDRGRRKVNYSEWDLPQEDAHDAAKAVQEGEMPPWYYPWARLSRAEREELAQGLATAPGQAPRRGRDRHDDDD
jgi:hypothetical protein